MGLFDKVKNFAVKQIDDYKTQLSELRDKPITLSDTVPQVKADPLKLKPKSVSIGDANLEYGKLPEVKIGGYTPTMGKISAQTDTVKIGESTLTESKKDEIKRLTPVFDKQIALIDAQIKELSKSKPSISPIAFFKTLAGQSPLDSNTHNLMQLSAQKKELEEIKLGKKEGVLETLKEDLTGNIPIISDINDIADTIELARAGEKIAKGKSLTARELYAYNKLLIDDYTQKTLGGTVAGGVLSTAKYGAEFAISGGIVGGIKKGITKVAEESVEQAVKLSVKNLAKNVGFAIAQIPFQPSFYADAVKRNIAPSLDIVEKNGELFAELKENDKGFLEATTRALGSSFVNNFSESLGQYLPKPKALEKLKDSLLSKWIDKKGIGAVTALVAKKIRWNGILGEILEEEIAEPALALIDEKKYFNPITTKEGRERLFVETLTIGLFGALMGSPQLHTAIKDAYEEVKADTRGSVPADFGLGGESDIVDRGQKIDTETKGTRSAEIKSGWKQDIKPTFDKALNNNDIETVKNLLPQVPRAYKIKFANKIREVSGLDMVSQAKNEYTQATIKEKQLKAWIAKASKKEIDTDLNEWDAKQSELDEIESVTKTLRPLLYPSEPGLIERGEKYRYKVEDTGRAKFRIDKLKDIKYHYRLSDAEFKKIASRDIHLMSVTGKDSFTNYINEVIENADSYTADRSERTQYLAEIRSKELKKEDNIRMLLNFPTVSKMSTEQLKIYASEIDKLKTGETVLSKRTLQTIDRTNMSGLKTNEDILRYLKDVGIEATEEHIANLKGNWIHRKLYDSALARTNPIVGAVVNIYHTAQAEAGIKALKIKDTLDIMAKKARKSRWFNFREKLLKQDRYVFNWLNSPNRAELETKMTPEELEYAHYVQTLLLGYKNILDSQKLTNKTLKNFKAREFYVPYIGRGFFETIKEDGVVKAIKKFLNREGEKEIVARDDIYNMPDNVISFDKFFSYALKRTGIVDPTMNVAKAVSVYTDAFFKKQSADAVVPQIQAILQAVDPKNENVLFRNFINQWISSKNGKVADLIFSRGSVPDTVIRGLVTLTSTLDLGLSIPVGLASTVGEAVSNYRILGVKKQLLGNQRKFTKKGKTILKKYDSFTGKSIWTELARASDSMDEIFLKTMFSFFHQSAYMANRTFLLGELTKDEYNSGEISNERLAELKLKMGLTRVVRGLESVEGKTAVGGMVKQYKTWAVPHLLTFAQDLQGIATTLKTDGVRKVWKTDEFSRSVIRPMLSGIFALIVYVIASNADDDSFIGKLKNKLVREAFSILSAINPLFWTTSPRIVTYVTDMSNATKEIIRLDKYVQKGRYGDVGDLKGVGSLKKINTPSLIKGVVFPQDISSGKPKPSFSLSPKTQSSSKPKFNFNL